jgi:hypothetical protein
MGVESAVSRCWVVGFVPSEPLLGSGTSNDTELAVCKRFKLQPFLKLLAEFRIIGSAGVLRPIPWSRSVLRQLRVVAMSLRTRIGTPWLHTQQLGATTWSDYGPNHIIYALPVPPVCAGMMIRMMISNQLCVMISIVYTIRGQAPTGPKAGCYCRLGPLFLFPSFQGSISRR